MILNTENQQNNAHKFIIILSMFSLRLLLILLFLQKALFQEDPRVSYQEKRAQYIKDYSSNDPTSFHQSPEQFMNIKTYEQFDMRFRYRKYFYSYQRSYREQIFYQNLKKIRNFNIQKIYQYSLDINQFADMDQKEFRSQFASLQPQQAIYDIRDTRLLQAQQTTYINKIDWSCYSGSVDNQGICGSCYAFVAADTVSTLYGIHKKNRNLKLSVQELVSCSDAVLENGCQGGLFQNTFEYIMNKGLTSAFNYPYASAFTRQPPACDIQKLSSGKKWKIKSYRNIERNCQSVKYQLQAGPIAVGINSQNLQFYRNGSFKGSINGFTDHAVLLVGYDKEKGFKIKNIWGRTWGILGYGWVDEIQHAGLCSRAINIDIPGQKKGIEQCIKQQFIKSNDQQLNETILNTKQLNETEGNETQYNETDGNQTQDNETEQNEVQQDETGIQLKSERILENSIVLVQPEILEFPKQPTYSNWRDSYDSIKSEYDVWKYAPISNEQNAQSNN